MNAAKARGTSWESAIVNYLSNWWPLVERRALQGTGDRGDISGIPGWIIEAKSYTKAWRLPEWWREVQRERVNAGSAAYGILWVKRTGKTSPAQGWVIMDGETYVRLLKDAGW